MNEAVRCLRDGCLPGRLPALVLLEDSTDVIGGPAVCAQLVREVVAAIPQQRTQASRAVLVSLSSHAHASSATLTEQLGPALHTLDIKAEDSRALQGIASVVADTDPASMRSLQTPAPATQPCQGLDLCLILDSLSSLLFLHPPHQVLELLDELLRCTHVSCILATLHKDVHDADTVAALEGMAACMLRLLPPPSAAGSAPHSAGPAVDLQLQALLKLRTGRVRVVTQNYQQLPDGSLQEVRQKATVELKAQHLPAAAAAGGKAAAPVYAGSMRSREAATEAAAQAALAHAMGGGMRLTLTQREADARQAVVLPWEQRQAGARSQDDFVAASAPGVRPASGIASPHQAGGQQEAGRQQPQQQGYGHILYERDSETDPDSDEDPDDDLDF